MPIMAQHVKAQKAPMRVLSPWRKQSTCTLHRRLQRASFPRWFSLWSLVRAAPAPAPASHLHMHGKGLSPLQTRDWTRSRLGRRPGLVLVAGGSRTTPEVLFRTAPACQPKMERWGRTKQRPKQCNCLPPPPNKVCVSLTNFRRRSATHGPALPHRC